MPSKDSTSPVILIVIMLAGLIGGYFYYSQIASNTVIEVPAAPVASEDNLSKFKHISLDFGILNGPAFKVLHTFGEAPVIPGSTGKTDLFAPF